MKTEIRTLHAMASRSRQLAVPGLPFFHRGHLRERVVHLCKEVPMSRPRVVALVIAFAVLLALTAGVGILAFPRIGKTGPKKTWSGPKPLEIQGEVQNVEPLYAAAPRDSERVKRDHSNPPVSMRIIVDQEGKVHDPAVTVSSGDPAVDQAALNIISRWTFKPATLHGKPVPVYVDITLGMNF